MLNDFDRYAIYWQPPVTDSLARFGCDWTGWCAESGDPHSLRVPGARVVNREIAHLGLHGTVCGPFRLRDGSSRWALEDVLRGVAEDHAAVDLPGLELAVVEGQVVLVAPPSDTRSAKALSGIIAEVEAAVAPVREAEPRSARARAAAAGTVRQLPAAGAQKFRIPLTDKLDVTAAFEVMERLRPFIDPILDQERRVSDLALMGDPGGGRPLRLLQRLELGDAAARLANSVLPCSGPSNLVPMPGERWALTDIAV